MNDDPRGGPFSPLNMPEYQRDKDAPVIRDERIPLVPRLPDVITADEARAAFDDVFVQGIITREDGERLQLARSDDGERLLNGRRSVDWTIHDARALVLTARARSGEAERRHKDEERKRSLDPKTNPLIKVL